MFWRSWFVEQFELFRPESDGGPQPPPHSQFASIADDFWILDTVGIDWAGFSTEVGSIFAAVGQQAFVLFQPWWPGVGRSRKLFESRFPNARMLGGALWATPESGLELVSSVFDLQCRIGKNTSGLWLFGLTNSAPQLADELVKDGDPVGPPVDLAIQARHYVEAALALDEGGMSTLLIRRQSLGLEQVIPLVERMQI